MKNLKRFLLISFASVLVILCVACTGKKDSQNGGQVELRVLNYYDMTAASAADEIPTVWEAFEKANPDIKLIREDLFNEPFHNKVEAYAAAGQLPDVVYAWPSGRSSTLHTQHLLKDLAPLIQRDGLASIYVPASLDPTAQGAGYIGILPRAITSSHTFYVNNEVLKDAGLSPAKTYAELKAQVPVLRAKGYDTVLIAQQDTWVMQSCFFSLVAGRFGGEGWEKKILSGQAKFTDSDFVSALEFIKTMYDDGVLTKATLTTDYGSVIGQFSTNKGAYLIDGDWRIAAFITDKSTGQALISPARQNSIDITVFPDISGAKLNKSTSTILGTGWGMNANIPAGSAKEDAAWRLIKWLSGKEVQSWLLETGGTVTPTRTDIDTGSLALEPMQKGGGALGTQYTTGTVVIDGAFHSDVYTPINDGLQQIGAGTRTPRQVAEAAQRAFDTWKASQ
ncbi:putative bacterial extracellular solute-binding protein [Treponema primitia ZAS-2]|uniref:Putative bacterial extracellular solute-binding protein n=1 Tax=Treponema primitia (strain ATCC BAA-887 / DSM 12427 / ZAS-2) TaxID=545694 RepID=F5YNU1_TREPZ|nr:extracellular solute-binding protein [Treponema primitia]AEF86427.1 putative bacterial extracellular solute-binding protein [Treponema primitia ZAS-2]